MPTVAELERMRAAGSSQGAGPRMYSVAELEARSSRGAAGPRTYSVAELEKKRLDMAKKIRRAGAMQTAGNATEDLMNTIAVSDNPVDRPALEAALAQQRSMPTVAEVRNTGVQEVANEMDLRAAAAARGLELQWQGGTLQAVKPGTKEAALQLRHGATASTEGVQGVGLKDKIVGAALGPFSTVSKVAGRIGQELYDPATQQFGLGFRPFNERTKQLASQSIHKPGQPGFPEWSEQAMGDLGTAAPRATSAAATPLAGLGAGWEGLMSGIDRIEEGTLRDAGEIYKKLSGDKSENAMTAWADANKEEAERHWEMSRELAGTGRQLASNVVSGDPNVGRAAGEAFGNTAGTALRDVNPYNEFGIGISAAGKGLKMAAGTAPGRAVVDFLTKSRSLGGNSPLETVGRTAGRLFVNDPALMGASKEIRAEGKAARAAYQGEDAVREQQILDEVRKNIASDPILSRMTPEELAQADAGATRVWGSPLARANASEAEMRMVDAVQKAHRGVMEAEKAKYVYDSPQAKELLQEVPQQAMDLGPSRQAMFPFAVKPSGARPPKQFTTPGYEGIAPSNGAQAGLPLGGGSALSQRATAQTPAPRNLELFGAIDDTKPFSRANVVFPKQSSRPERYNPFDLALGGGTSEGSTIRKALAGRPMSQQSALQEAGSAFERISKGENPVVRGLEASRAASEPQYLLKPEFEQFLENDIKSVGAMEGLAREARARVTGAQRLDAAVASMDKDVWRQHYGANMFEDPMTWGAAHGVTDVAGMQKALAAQDAVIIHVGDAAKASPGMITLPRTEATRELAGQVVPRRYAKLLEDMSKPDGLREKARSSATFLERLFGSKQLNAALTQQNARFSLRNFIPNFGRVTMDVGSVATNPKLLRYVSEFSNVASAERAQAEQMLKIGGQITGQAKGLANEAASPMLMESLGMGGARKGFAKAVKLVNRPGEMTNEAIEATLKETMFPGVNPNYSLDDATRMWHYLAQRSKGMSPKVAAYNTNTLLIDYADKTIAEEALKPFAPFIKYYTGAVQGALRLAIKEPGRFMRLHRVANTLMNYDTAYKGNRATNAKYREEKDVLTGQPILSTPGDGLEVFRVDQPAGEAQQVIEAGLTSLPDFLKPESMAGDKGGSLLSSGITDPFKFLTPKKYKDVTGWSVIPGIDPKLQDILNAHGQTLPQQLNYMRSDELKNMSKEKGYPDPAAVLGDHPDLAAAFLNVSSAPGASRLMPMWASGLIRPALGMGGASRRSSQRKSEDYSRFMRGFGPRPQSVDIEAEVFKKKKSYDKGAKIPTFDAWGSSALNRGE